MAFNDFTIEEAEARLQIRVRRGDLFPNLATQPVPEWLSDFLRRGRELPLVSEKARSEFIVGPILLACRDLSGGAIAIFSGQRLDVAPDRGLQGECDFILAVADGVPRLRAPLVTIVEAKKNDIEVGLGQCIAQMVAAREFNDKHGDSIPAVFGCVTTGESWQFLRLTGGDVQIDNNRLYIDNVGAILGAFAEIIRTARAKKL